MNGQNVANPVVRENGHDKEVLSKVLNTMADLAVMKMLKKVKAARRILVRFTENGDNGPVGGTVMLHVDKDKSLDIEGATNLSLKMAGLTAKAMILNLKTAKHPDFVLHKMGNGLFGLDGHPAQLLAEKGVF